MLQERIKLFTESYKQIKKENFDNISALPGKNFFLSDKSILSVPREIGDSRFPYGKDGFNFWTYSSGYMHANEGLFSVFLRAKEGQEPNLAFFAGKKNGESYDVLPILAVPETKTDAFGEVDRYTVFDQVATYYICETRDFKFVVRVYIDINNKLNFTFTAENLSGVEEEIYLSWYFKPSLNHSIYESEEDRWCRRVDFKSSNTIKIQSESFELNDCSSEKLSADELGYFIFSVNEDLSRYKSVSNFGVLNQRISLIDASLLKIDASTSRTKFVGTSRSSLHAAKALIDGATSRQETTAFTEYAVAAELAFVNFKARGKARVDFSLDYLLHTEDKEAYRPLIHDIDVDELEENINKHYEELKHENSLLEIDFSNSEFENLDAETLSVFTSYLKKQVEFCATIKGFIQLSMGSLIGIRDVYQAIEAVLFYKPEIARAKMLEGLEFIDPSGRAPRQYSLPSFEGSNPIMDLRPFIDQGHWVIDTFVTYLKYTGDFSILDEELAYHEIVDEAARLVRKTDKKDSALLHLLTIMDFLISNIDEDTKCLKALFGDWNDALDGLGVSKNPNKEYGNGVSVMASLQLYRNLEEMSELLNYLGKHLDKAIEYDKLRQELRTGLLEYAVLRDGKDLRIAHGWGEDRDYYVGSFNDPDKQARYGLTAPAFWVISRLYNTTPELKTALLETFQNLDSKYGLKTFEPGFEPGTAGVGRIHKLPIGTAENGAVYIHGAVFGTAALFGMGESKLAWEQLEKNLPFTKLHKLSSHSPYVMPNSYGENAELNIDGESMNDWQTGSSNVVFKIIMFYVFGLRFEYDGLKLQAANYRPFEKMNLSMKYRGKDLRVRLIKDESSPERIFKLNGKEIEKQYDEVFEIYTCFITSEDMDSKESIEIEIIN